MSSLVSQAALISVLLGIVFGGSLVLSISLPSVSPLALYIALLCLFHFLEFYLTALAHQSTLDIQAFLLDHSLPYTLSIIASLAEFFLLFFMDSYWNISIHFGMSSRIIGFGIALMGQTLRSMAMLQAKESFTHEVADKKTTGHKLVTTGLYSLIRHPSYTGYYLWALGCQLLLGNYACLVLFALILYKFFSERIPVEEYHLHRFFPDEYELYKKRTWSGIPFIR